MIEATFVNPVLCTFLGIKVYSYGIMVAAALAACTLSMHRDIQRLNIDTDAAMIMITFLPGFLVGSKGQMVISAYLSGEPMPSLSLESGHSFMGAAVGGILCSACYGYWCGLSLLRLLDIIAPVVPLGHAVGKLGCFLSGDGCYGPPSSLPWAMSFPNGGVPTREAVHPTPLYESMLSLTLYAFLFFPYAIPAPEEGRRLPVGRRTAVTLVLYGIERMIVEPFRRHPASEYLLGLTEYQFLALIFIAVGLGITALARRYEPWPGSDTKKEA